MKKSPRLFGIVCVPAVIGFCAAGTVLFAQRAAPADAKWRAYWQAAAEGDVRKAAQAIVQSGPSFESVQQVLVAGRPYAPQPTGRVALATTVSGEALDNQLEVPADYDPKRRWSLRVSLHGGVGRQAPGPGDAPPRALSNRVPSAVSELVLHPRAWALTAWWERGQVQNIHNLIARIKHTYNVDESRTYLTGISDGGTGVYFLGMRDATRWAVCMPLNGHPSVLANPSTGADGELFPHNLVNCPIHAVNGGRDRLYPAASVKPLIDAFTRGGIPIEWQVYPEADHDVSWWPTERAGYDAFVATHPRVAHPAAISWETERTDRYNRFRWLVIDRLGARGSDVPLPDVNTIELPSGRRQLYSRGRHSGRADVTRSGNRFDVRSRGVEQFTLLLSPDVVDFARPIEVVVNGKRLPDVTVKRNVATLMKWAAIDDDRTMLYGAEVPVTVP